MAPKMASGTHDIVWPEQVDFIDDLMMPSPATTPLPNGVTLAKHDFFRF
jgi:hypothetical protein